MLEKCNNCRRRVVFRQRTATGIFCSRECAEFYEHPTFCDTCLADTLPESAGSTTTINSVGTKLCWGRDKCPTCKSVVQHKFFCALLIPILPLGRFRVKRCSPQQYLSRK